jgi:hemoglobin-like flavoprotein
MDIGESLHRVLEDKQGVAELFYQRFLDGAPEVQRHFDGVNMRYQQVMLTMALMAIERQHRSAYPATASYLRHLGTKHQARGIPAELYSKFREDLLAALGQFHGPDWDGPLASQWAEAIDGATRIMLEGYWEHCNV